jgi:hypothetical protein
MSAAGTDLLPFIEIVDHFYARKILRQWFALGLATGVFRDDQGHFFHYTKLLSLRPWSRQ